MERSLKKLDFNPTVAPGVRQAQNLILSDNFSDCNF